MPDSSSGDPRVRLIDPTRSGDAAAALRALDRFRVVVDVGPMPPVAASAAAVAAAVAARLFAHVEVVGQAALPTVNPWHVDNLGDVLPSLASIRPDPACEPTGEITLAIGDTGRRADIGAGGGAWTARLGHEPQRLDEPAIAGHGHALGLHAAAALAVNELMKRALTPVGFTALPMPPGAALTWNLVDYQLGDSPGDLQPQSVHRPVMLAGCGSVGGTAAGLLAMTSVTGDGVVVDAENLDPERNPIRYPLLRGEEDKEKTAWAADLLTSAGWRVDQCSDGIREWLGRAPAPGFDGLVVSSVDDLQARLDVTDILPRDVCSVGVAGLALHLQRERLGDGYACPYCDFVQAAPPSTQADVTAQQLGLPVTRVLELTTGSRLTADDLAQCVAAGAIREGTAATLRGHRLDDLIARSYAEVGLGRVPGAAGTPAAPPVHLAAPQVSWIAATLAAAEVVKYLTGLPGLDRRVDLDLTGLPQGFTRRVAPDDTGRCACASPHRRGWMRRMYS